MTKWLVRKVEGGEVAKVFLRSHVVGLSGVNLVLKIAEKNRLAVGHYPDSPAFFAIVPGEAFVF